MRFAPEVTPAARLRRLHCMPALCWHPRACGRACDAMVTDAPNRLASARMRQSLCSLRATPDLRGRIPLTSADGPSPSVGRSGTGAPYSAALRVVGAPLIGRRCRQPTVNMTLPLMRSIELPTHRATYLIGRRCRQPARRPPAPPPDRADPAATAMSTGTRAVGAPSASVGAARASSTFRAFDPDASNPATPPRTVRSAHRSPQSRRGPTSQPMTFRHCTSLGYPCNRSCPPPWLSTGGSPEAAPSSAGTHAPAAALAGLSEVDGWR